MDHSPLSNGSPSGPDGIVAEVGRWGVGNRHQKRQETAAGLESPVPVILYTFVYPQSAISSVLVILEHFASAFPNVAEVHTLLGIPWTAPITCCFSFPNGPNGPNEPMDGHMPGVVLANGGHSASEETGGDRTEGDIPFLGPQKSHGER